MARCGRPHGRCRTSSRRRQPACRRCRASTLEIRLWQQFLSHPMRGTGTGVHRCSFGRRTGCELPPGDGYRRRYPAKGGRRRGPHPTAAYRQAPSRARRCLGRYRGCVVVGNGNGQPCRTFAEASLDCALSYLLAQAGGTRRPYASRSARSVAELRPDRHRHGQAGSEGTELFQRYRSDRFVRYRPDRDRLPRIRCKSSSCG